MPEHKHTPRPQRLTAIYAMLGGRTTSFRARISDDLALPPHASTAHFSAPIMFTALKTACFLITSLGLGAPAENGEAEVVLLGRVRLLAERTALSRCFSCVGDGTDRVAPCSSIGTNRWSHAG